MSIQGAINSALGVTAAATRFGQYNLKSAEKRMEGPEAEMERAKELYQVKEAEAAKRLDAKLLEQKRKQAIADEKAIAKAKEAQKKEFAQYKEQFRDKWGVLGDVGRPGLEAFLKSGSPESESLKSDLLKSKEMEAKLNGK